MNLHREAGFTLIELAAASAIAAVLMGGVLMVFTAIAHDRQRIARVSPSDAFQQRQIVELVRRDFNESTRFQVTANGAIHIHTFSSIGVRTLERSNRPVEVTYRIDDRSGASCLVREQVLKDEVVPSSPLRSLLAVGVKKMDVKPAVEGDGAMQSAIIGGQSSQQQRMPSRFRIRLQFENPASDLDQTVLLR